MIPSLSGKPRASLRHSLHNINNQDSVDMETRLHTRARIGSLEEHPRHQSAYTAGQQPDLMGSVQIPRNDAYAGISDKEIILMSTVCGYVLGGDEGNVVARIREMENARASIAI